MSAKKIDQRHRDKHGLIVQTNNNGGDTANRTGLFRFAQALLNFETKTSFMYEISLLEIEPGIYIRHPDRSFDWEHPDVRDFAQWNNPDVFSRDQWVNMCIALGAWGLKIHLKDLWKAHKKRWFLQQNKDLTGPFLLA